MNKAELVAIYAKRSGQNELVAAGHVAMVLQALAEGLRDEGKITVSNFGVLEIVEVKPRKFRTPQGKIAERRQGEKVRFRPAPNLVEYLNGKDVKIAVGMPRGIRS